ncbi:hypothetical protein B0A52_02646 [Exophiala mesophila]|uniref:NmrA-like domain-containing protein n=1 Tax=Exophiala mesophila TaxID=212818 RepID=A0A438NDJ8_EXOME|nr:hypothetical protein B0A52_02646 [Exophiala mesophila]
MSAQYAKDQPSGFSNHVSNVAIVGAGGTVGKYMTEALLKTGKHKVTALTREGSPNKLPEGIVVKKVNYDNTSSLIEALKGQDVFIITMNVLAPVDSEKKLIEAAAEAGVPWILPNEWSTDPTQVQLGADTYLGDGRQQTRELVVSLGKSAYLSMISSFWYEFSLAGSENCFGFDFPKKKVTFYDDGKTAINTSTFLQCGRAVAALLSLKVLPEDENDKSPTISQFRNGPVYLSSFNISQKDMFESVLRVTGTTEQDWTVRYQDSHERYKEGQERMNGGDRAGFAQLLYARVFYPTDEANYERRGLLHNEILGLPKEDLDEATKRGVEMVGQPPYNP